MFFRFAMLVVVFGSFFQTYGEKETVVADSAFQFFSKEAPDTSATCDTIFETVTVIPKQADTTGPATGFFCTLDFTYTSPEMSLSDQFQSHGPGFSVKTGLDLERVFQISSAIKHNAGTSVFLSFGGSSIFRKGEPREELAFQEDFLAVRGMFCCLQYGLGFGGSMSSLTSGKFRPAKSYLFGMRIPVSNIWAIDYEYRREYVSLQKLVTSDYLYYSEFALAGGALGTLSFIGDWFLESGRYGLLAAITMKAGTLGCAGLMLALEDRGREDYSAAEHLVLNHHVLAFSILF